MSAKLKSVYRNFISFFLIVITYGHNVVIANNQSEMEKFQIVPDVIDKTSAAVLEVSYSGNIRVNQGNELTPSKVKDPPLVNWNADDNELYVLIMVDPDAPSRQDPKFREWQHWLVGNIPGGKLQQGEVLSEYMGSTPPKGTGLHRYAFLAFKQPSKLQFDEERLTNKSSKGRGKFSTRSFAKKYNLGDTIAGNFFQAQWEATGKLPQDVYQTAKVSKILMAVNKGDSSQFKGKSFNDIKVSENDLVDSESDSDNESIGKINSLKTYIKKPTNTLTRDANTSGNNMTDNEEINITGPSRAKCEDKPTKKPLTRVRWSEEQKKIICKHFANHIKSQKPPKRNEVEDFKKEFKKLFKDRNWVVIKAFVYNAYRKNK